MTNGSKRPLPGLIEVRPAFNGPQQTVKPMFDRYGCRKERTQFTNIPALYSVKPKINANQSNFFNNTQSTISSYTHNQPNDQSTRMNPSFYTQNSSIFKNNNNFENGENQITYRKLAPKNIETEKKSTEINRDDFANLLARIVPGYSFLAKSKKNASNKTNTAAETDTSDDNSASSSQNASNIEPVNSLRTRMETKPLFKTDWELDLNKKYADLVLSRRDKIKAEEESSISAELKTREVENKFNESLKKLSIGTLFSYDIEEEEKPANDFPELEREHQSKIVGWINGRDGRTVLSSKFNLSITKVDIQTLNWRPITWLNDEVINFYMELIAERSRKDDDLPNAHAMNTFFLPRLLDHGYSGVRRWTRIVDIFAFDVILVPVHKGVHWCMAIIHFKNKTIKYYDSMGGTNNPALQNLAEYLKQESLDKKKVEFDMSDWTLENVQDIPQQDNGSDCDVFSCMFAEFISRNRPIVFSQKHMTYFRMKMVYEICTGQMLN